MPTVALDVLSNCEVRSLNVAPNQAAVLEVFHAIKVTDGAALTVGTVVSYTDDDLGYIFYGKVVEVKKAYSDGEGLVYTCTDAYRTLVKQPAVIISDGQRSSKLKFDTGTLLSEAVTAIMAEVSTYFPGGVDNTADDVELPLLDKGGQAIDTWLEDILQSTDDGIAYVDPNAGSPKLVMRSYASANDVTLRVGAYDIINPASGELLLENGDIGDDVKQKYEKVTVQGSGMWLRHESEFINAVLYFSNRDIGLFQYRWYVPDNKKITCRMIDEDGVCKDLCMMRLKIGGNNPAAFRMDIENPPIGVDDDDGSLFWFQNFKIHGTSIDEPFRPPAVEAWFDYTSYEGPLSITITSTDDALAGEGELWQIHDEFCDYESSIFTLDGLTAITALAQALFARYSDQKDQTGTLNLHIKGLNADLQLGSAITNFSDMRVRSMRYDFVTRTIQCAISDVPLRTEINALKQRAKDLTLQGGNWYVSRTQSDTCCFSDLGLLVDQNGNAADIGNTPGPLEGEGPSWDCQRGECVEVQGDQGPYKSLQDCERVCYGNGYDCIDCVGCIAVGDGPQGQFDTLEDCLDHMNDPAGDCLPPDDPGCGYDCDVNNQCVQDPNGVFATLGECLAVCFAPGEGGGGHGGIDGSGYPSGLGGSAPGFLSGGLTSGEFCCGSGSGGVETFVRCVIVDNYGHVLRVECSTPSGTGSGTIGPTGPTGPTGPQGPPGSGGAVSGHTGNVDVVCLVQCSGETLIVKNRTFQFSTGLLIDPGTCE